MKNIYFAQNNASSGIIEGIEHYKFIQKAGAKK
jgi:hypothetical protein